MKFGLDFSYHYHPRVFGLDISDLVVKAIELKRTRHSFELQAVAERGVPPGWIQNGQIKEPAKLSQLLRAFLSEPLQGKFTTRYCVASLPEQKTFIKLIDIERYPDSELNEAVRWAASQHIPFALEEVELDFELHPEMKLNRTTPALVSVAPKELVESYTGALASAGLSPWALDLESTAIARSSAHPDSQGTELIIDLGGNRTNVCIVYRGVVHFSSNLPFSGSDLTRTISERLHLSLAEAEKAKHIFGLNPSKGHGKIRAILLPELRALVSKIQEISTFTANHFSSLPPIDKTVLTGGSALLIGLKDHLSELLGRPVEFATAPIREKNNNGELPLGVCLRFTTAIGLALYHVHSQLK